MHSASGSRFIVHLSVLKLAAEVSLEFLKLAPSGTHIVTQFSYDEPVLHTLCALAVVGMESYAKPMNKIILPNLMWLLASIKNIFLGPETRSKIEFKESNYDHIPKYP